jgi:hypothetical protein
MIVEPTQSEFQNQGGDQPFSDSRAVVGVALAPIRDSVAGAIPCLRKALAAAGAAPPVCRIPIVRDRDCAPRLATSSHWRLSLAHSGKQIAAAAAYGLSVGIDLEYHRLRDFPRLARLLGWSAATASTFYPRWTLAEALYKAGAATGPTCFTVAEDALAAMTIEPPRVLELMLAQRRWRVRWHHESAPVDRLSFSICLVWSELP